MGWGILLLNPPIRSCLPVESEIYTGCKEENQDKYSPAGILPSKTLGKVIQDWYFCKRLNPQRMKRGQLELYCDHTSVSRDQSKTDLIQLVRWLFILCSNWKSVCKMIVSFYARPLPQCSKIKSKLTSSGISNFSFNNQHSKRKNLT